MLEDGTAADRPIRLSLDLADLARDAVTVAAPAQLALLDEAIERWRAGRAPRRRVGWGGTVGSGVIATLTSDVAYPVLVGALAQVCGSAVVAGWQRRPWWRRLRRRRPATAPVPQVSVVLDRVRLREIRAACVEHAVRMGLPRPEAHVLADAILGVLYQATLTTGSSETCAD